jgi:pimeloyl-ACP methyl ester carboxylesterase
MSNTVLLIHGAWLNSRSWDAVKARYEAKRLHRPRARLAL